MGLGRSIGGRIQQNARPGSSVTAGATTGVFNIADFGAKSDGATDDTTAVQAAVAAAIAAGAGGVVQYPPGLTLVSAALNVDSTVDVSFRGYGGRPEFFSGIGNNTPRSELRYTASGTGSLISAKSAVGFKVQGLALRYSNASYTGTLIDLSAIANIPAYGVTFRDCLIGGASSSAVNAALLLNCRQGVEFHFADCALERAVIGVYGRDAGSWSNALQFTSCHFAALGTSIFNPYAQWLFSGCTFEPATMAQVGLTTTGGFGAIFAQDAAPMQGVTFIGCGFWDTTGGTWINVAGRGLSLYGCYWEPQGGSADNLVTVRTSVLGTSFDGLVISGLTASGVSSAGATVLAWSASSSSHKLTGIDVSGLNLSGGVKDGIDGLTAGVVQFAAGNGAARLTDLGTSTTAATLTAAPAQKLLLGGNTTITLPSVGAAGVRHTFDVTLQQDTTGSRTVTWPGAVKWAGGSAPTLTVTPHHADTVRLFTDDGVVWCGSVLAANWAGPSVADAAVITATANGPGAVRLTWSAPNDNGSAITDYVVQYRTTAGPGSWLTYTHSVSTANAIVVGGLTNGTSYDFQIAAINLVGQAPFSNAPAATPVLGYNPLTSITWAAAYWAADPSWTFPGDGSQVSSWRDGSGNSRTLTQPVTAARNPLFRTSVSALNNQFALEWDGGDDELSTPSFSLAQQFSVVAILADPTVGVGGRLLSDSAGNVQVYWTTVYNMTAGTVGTYGSVSTGGKWLVDVFNGASSAGIVGASSTAESVGTNGIAGGLTVGARGDHSLYGASKIAFLGIYAGDIRSDAGYAALKSWATTLYGVAT